jgi:hypothetical protein
MREQGATRRKYSERIAIMTSPHVSSFTSFGKKVCWWTRLGKAKGKITSRLHATEGSCGEPCIRSPLSPEQIRLKGRGCLCLSVVHELSYYFIEGGGFSNCSIGFRFGLCRPLACLRKKSDDYHTVMVRGWSWKWKWSGDVWFWTGKVWNMGYC